MSYTILAIDDSPTLRKFITKHLVAYSAQYEVLTAADGTEGIALASEREPDLILLDFNFPDMNGEDVCIILKENPVTADIPIILMSSSTPDITRTEGKFSSIKRSLIKPFSPQLLSAAVSFVLQSDDGKSTKSTTKNLTPAQVKQILQPESLPTMMIPKKIKGSVTAPIELAFKANTSYFPLILALRGIATKKHSGVLRFQHPNVLMEIYFKSGLFVVATSRNPTAYFKDAPISVSEEEKPLLEELKLKQSETGHPVFMQMEERGILFPENAAQMTYQYGVFMFALAWTAQDSDFEFEKLNELPHFLHKSEPLFNSADSFALESLRLVGAECLVTFDTNSATGTPAYTSSGYKRIQNISLNEEEISFANQVILGGQSLNAIATASGMDIGMAHRILFRFLNLEIFDYWPAAE